MALSEDDVLNIVRANPGATIGDVQRELSRRSKRARWFGEDSLIVALFGVGFGGVSIAMWRLEREGKLTASWGTTPPGSKYRQRHYFTVT